MRSEKYITLLFFMFFVVGALICTEKTYAALQENKTYEPKIKVAKVVKPEKKQAKQVKQEPGNTEAIALLAPKAEQYNFSDEYPLEINGFLDVRYGGRTKKFENQNDSIAEAIMRVELNQEFEWGYFQIKEDFVGDMVEKKLKAELRQASLSFSPLEIMDIKVGRQTLTWGTGDLLFINDLFSKDWVSFFIGRDIEYLKKPSDSIKASIFFESFDLDFVYTPLFGGSDYISGERLSYWNPMAAKIAGRDNILITQARKDYPDDSEYAMRLSKNINGNEFALYGYHGFWQTPEGIDPITYKFIYPRLTAYGASLRGDILGGIGSLEVGYNDSREDKGNMKPFVRNSEIRFLTGFEREIKQDFVASVQHYMEYMQDYDEYKSATGDKSKHEFRQILTLRLTQNLMNQNLILSWFNYYSPTDRDGYILPGVLYKASDNLSFEAGCNFFFGKDDHTFFSAFKNNDNVFFAMRYNF